MATRGHIPDDSAAFRAAARGYAARVPARVLVALGPLESLELADGRTLRWPAGRQPLLVRDDRGWLRALPPGTPCRGDASGLPPAARRFYTALHEGRAPDCVARRHLPALPAAESLAPVGVVAAVTYAKKTTEPGAPPRYRHPFAPHARPWVAAVCPPGCRGERGVVGLPHFVGGLHHVSTRGITDMALTSAASRRGRRRAAKRSNPSAYLVNPTPAPAAPRHNPKKKSSGGGSSRKGFGTPSASAEAFLGELVKAVAVAGGAQLVGTLGLGLTSMGDPAKLATLGTTALVGALIAYRYDQTSAIALGALSVSDLVAAGMATPTVQNQFREIKASLLGAAAPSAPAPPASAPPASSSSPPPAGRILPAGQLAEFSGMATNASCGIGRR
jgi:hypothetical protein